MSKAIPYMIGVTRQPRPKTPEERAKEYASIADYLRQSEMPNIPHKNLHPQKTYNNQFYRPFGYPERSIDEIENNLKQTTDDLSFKTRCGINGFGQGMTAYNFDEFGGLFSGVNEAVQSGLSGTNPFPVFQKEYTSTRNNQRVDLQECYRREPVITHGGELAGAIALELLSRGRLPAAYLARPMGNLAHDLGIAGVNALGQSEQPEDLVPNMANNLSGNIVGQKGADIFNTPQNIFIEQVLAKAAEIGYQATKNYLDSKKSK